MRTTAPLSGGGVIRLFARHPNAANLVMVCEPGVPTQKIADDDKIPHLKRLVEIDSKRTEEVSQYGLERKSNRDAADAKPRKK